VTQSITGKHVAWCGSMKPDTRRRWAKVLGLLAPGPEFSEFDVVLTAVAGALIDATTSHRAPDAFEAVMPDLRRAYVAGKRDLWIVVPVEGDSFRFAESATRAAADAAQAGCSAWTISLRGPISAALARYARLVAGTVAKEAGIHELRLARDGSEQPAAS
jgi:hypothetical protein